LALILAERKGLTVPGKAILSRISWTAKWQARQLHPGRQAAYLFFARLQRSAGGQGGDPGRILEGGCTTWPPRGSRQLPEP
jgi:hypothetical protein